MGTGFGGFDLIGPLPRSGTLSEVDFREALELYRLGLSGLLYPDFDPICPGIFRGLLSFCSHR